MRKLLSLLFVCFGVASYAQLCAGSTGTINAQNPQNLGNPQYSLNPGGFFPISGTNQFAITPSVTTSYTIYTTGTNSASAVVTTSAVLVVTVFPQPILTPTVIQPNCTSTVSGFNLNLTWFPAAPVPTYAITWSSIPNGVLSAQQTSVASGVLAGPYSATIIAASGCGYIATFAVNAPPAPANFSLTPFAQTMTLNCITPTIDIVASNTALNYTWSSNCAAPISNTNAVNLSSVCLGSYTAVGQNTVTGCTKTVTFNLVQNIQTPTMTVSPSLFQSITCTNSPQTVTLVANPPLNINFSMLDSQQGFFSSVSPTTVISPVVGTTTVTLTNLVNGCTAVKVITVTSAQGTPTYVVQSPSNFTLGCNSKSVAVVNINNAAASTPGAPVSYTIIGPGTSSSVPSGSLGGVQTYSLNVPGQYTVIVRESPSFCETRSNISILSYTAPPNITTTQDYLILDCSNTVTTLYGASETPNVSYNWGYQNFNVPTSTVVATASLAANTNTVVNNYTLTVTDISSTCKSTSVVTIYQNLYPPKAQFALGTGSITCKTPTITLTNTSFTQIKTNAVITNSTGPIIGWAWYGPTPQPSLALSTTYIGYVPGVYTITAKDSNNGCIATATQSVNDYRDYPQIQTNNKTYSLNCGTPINIEPIYTTTFAPTYSWSPYKSTFPMPSVITTPTLVGVLSSGDYSVTVVNTDNGCISGATINVAGSLINASFDASTLEGYAPLTVSLTNNSASSVGTTTGISSYFSLGNGTYSTTSSNSINVIPVYLHPGTYSVALTVTKGACVDTMVKFIKVLLPSKLEVPNVFTPNGDGINDYYFLNAASMKSITFTVNDRWGHLIYEVTSSTGNVYWDGKNQAGVEVSEGTYFYVLKADGRDGGAYDQKGTIQLIR